MSESTPPTYKPQPKRKWLHGDHSWELDALDPTVLDAMISDAVEKYRNDDDVYGLKVQQERLEKSLLKATSDR